MTRTAVIAAATLLLSVQLSEPAVAGDVTLDIGDDWQCSAGDDPRWARPDFDDAQWVFTGLPETIGEGPTEGGFAWYRRNVVIDPAMLQRWDGVELALGLGHGFATAYAVYVDGELLGTHGDLDDDPSEAPVQAVAFDLRREAWADGEIMVALRVWQAPSASRSMRGTRWAGGDFVLGPAETVRTFVENAWLARRTTLVVYVVLGFVLFVIGAFHLLAWRGRRELAAYGWYGAFVTVQAVSFMLWIRGEPVWPYYSVGQAVVFEAPIRPLALAFLLEFLFSFLGARRPRWAPWLYVLLVVWTALVPFDIPGVRHGLTIVAYSVAIVGAAKVFLDNALRGGFAARTAGAAALLWLVVMLVGFTGPLLGLPTWAYVGYVLLGVDLDVPALLLFLATMAYALAEQVQGQLATIDASRRASARFVPTDFLTLLGRRDVIEVERGDVARQEMTVLFADVRGFTTRSEKQEPEQTFAWLNRYLATVEPVIIEHDGFVNQYYGDGIMALFASANDAVLAALAMQRAVGSADGLGADVRIGIGLHTGPLVLGTIGGADRLDTGVVGDAVNTAARVESLTKTHDVPILLTGATRDKLAGDVEDLRFDEIATVVPKGRSETITLFGVRESAEPSASTSRTSP